MHSNIKWFSLSPILSYTTGIFYFIDAARNIGKTWALQQYAWRRAFKHGKKCVLIRRTKEEARQAAEDLYNDPKLIDCCRGLKIYDTETQKGNFKKTGKTFYIKRNGKFDWFLKVIPLSQTKKFRGFSDERCDRILFDEYVTTERKSKHYVGNEASDLIDVFISIARQHSVKVIFCGNKENYSNPYYKYFNISPLPINFEGIRKYRGGTVIIQQYNQTRYENPQWESALKKLLSNTPYGNYLFNAQYKNSDTIVYSQAPSDAQGYAQFIFNDVKLSIKNKNEIFYVGNKPDITTYIMVDKMYPGIRWQKILTRKFARENLRAWQQAYIDNRINYENKIVMQATQKFMKWLGIGS